MGNQNSKKDIDEIEQTGGAYDDIPYPEYSFAQTQPTRLAAVARLFGLESALPSGARVLEIGCASGTNLIPWAVNYPQGKFLGIDLSQKQVDRANDTVAALGLSNILIKQMDVCELARVAGKKSERNKFDYVICHGVYSWVPPAAQKAILQVCGEVLTPKGVAYISYNVNPGWKMREVVRDLMLYHAGSLQDPAQKLAQGRAIVSYIQRISDPENTFGKLLKAEAELLTRAEDSYLLHDHFEVDNHPCYFKDFIAAADEAGLAFLGEANIAEMVPHHLGQEVKATLDMLSKGDIIATEQYMDFFRNRYFRQTLLVRKEDQDHINRAIEPEVMRSFHASAPFTPEGEVSINSGDEQKFALPNGRWITVKLPLQKAALTVLGQTYPNSMAFMEWVRRARKFLTGRETGVKADEQMIADLMLRLTLNGILDISVEPLQYGASEEASPVGFSFARHQAEKGKGTVTNGRHESMPINSLHRILLLACDGTRDRAAINQYVIERCINRELVVSRDGMEIYDEAQLTPMVEQLVSDGIRFLSKVALLVDCTPRLKPDAAGKAHQE
jgi:methyltransferase-like protein/2-polyprenyl-3-methyl-5-hydroxy-6-metoxy-1,4-benzoquinol methylase